MNKNENNYLTGGATEAAGEDFEAAAFMALLEDMAEKAHFLAGVLDILAEIGMEADDSGCGPDDMDGMEDGAEMEPETDLYLIPGGSFRLLVGDLYDLFVRHFSLEKRLAEAETEKDFRTIQKNASGYGRLMKRLCRKWGLPQNGEGAWACDTLEESLREKILTPAYPFEGHE